MGFFDSGSEESSQTTTTTNKSLNEGLRNSVLNRSAAAQDRLRRKVGKTGSAQGMTKDIRASHGLLNQAAGQMQGFLPQQQGLFSQLANFGGGSDALFNQQMSDIERSGMDRLMGQLGRSGTAEASVGQSGGTRRMDFDRSLKREGLMDIMAAQNQAGMQRQQMRQNALNQGLSQSHGVMDAMQRPAQLQNQVALQARDLENQKRASRMQKLDMMNSMSQGQVGSLAPLITPFGTSTSTTTTQTPTASPFSQLAGAGMAVGGMMAGGPAGASLGSGMGNAIFGMNQQGQQIPVSSVL